MRILSKMPKERYGEKRVRKQKNNPVICHFTCNFSGSGADYLFYGKCQGLQRYFCQRCKAGALLDAYGVY